MNKNDLINRVASTTGTTKSDAGNAVGAILDAISGSLQNGNDVRLVGFGTFSAVHRSARTGRNPQTGVSIYIPASNRPKFKAGKALKNAVN